MRHPHHVVICLGLTVAAGAWGLYWLPLRSIEQAGIVGSWSIVFVNACPLLILVPLLLFNLDQLKMYPYPIFQHTFQDSFVYHKSFHWQM